jgi:hypothetical protein
VIVLDQTDMVANKMFGVAQCAGGLPSAGAGGRGGSVAGRGGASANANGAGGSSGSASNAAGASSSGEDTSDPDGKSGDCSALPAASTGDAASHWLLALLLAAGTLGLRRTVRSRRP